MVLRPNPKTISMHEQSVKKIITQCMSTSYSTFQSRRQRRQRSIVLRTSMEMHRNKSKPHQQDIACNHSTRGITIGTPSQRTRRVIIILIHILLYMQLSHSRQNPTKSRARTFMQRIIIYGERATHSFKPTKEILCITSISHQEVSGEGLPGRARNNPRDRCMVAESYRAASNRRKDTESWRTENEGSTRAIPVREANRKPSPEQSNQAHDLWNNQRGVGQTTSEFGHPYPCHLPQGRTSMNDKCKGSGRIRVIRWPWSPGQDLQIDDDGWQGRCQAR